MDTHERYQESVPEEETDELAQERRVTIDIMDDSGRKSDMEDRRSVSSSRMPTNMTRAMLVRTPANKGDTPQAPSPDPTDESVEQHEPDVLITELKDQSELVEGDEDDESDIELEYRQVTVETVDAVDEDWDTDLEIEGNVAVLINVRNIKHENLLLSIVVAIEI